jgi:lysine-specific demethylase/histidyl-hydroxylase NO66
MKRKLPKDDSNVIASKEVKASHASNNSKGDAKKKAKLGRSYASPESVGVMPPHIVEVIECSLSNFGQKLGDLVSKPDGYKDVFGAIISDPDLFFNKFWEQKACIVRRRHPLTEKEGSEFFSKKYLADVLDDNIIAHSTNLTMCKYEDLKRVGKTFEGSFASSKEVLKAFKDGYTAQFYQPQRFSDGLYSVNAGFEYVFGSLAGASAYLTPPSSQGLAPHYDDVEVFIFQTEGTKRWRLWLNDKPLRDTCSHDIPRHLLPGESAEFVLHPGDILYMPRGTIHEADAMHSFSTHVTISVYQKNHYRAFLDKALPNIIDAAFDGNIEFRRGLPLRFQDFIGTFASTQTNEKVLASRKAFKSKLSDLLRSLADYISDESVDVAADEMVLDFVKNRLPPPDLPPTVEPEFSEASEDGNHLEFIDINKLNSTFASAPRVTKSSRVRLIDPRSFFPCIRDRDDASIDGCDVEGEKEGEMGPKKCLELFHSRNNNRLAHMNHPPPDYFVEKSAADAGSEDGSSDGSSAAEEAEGEGGEHSSSGEEDEGEEGSLMEGDEDSDGNVDCFTPDFICVLTCDYYLQSKVVRAAMCNSPPHSPPCCECSWMPTARTLR